MNKIITRLEDLAIKADHALVDAEKWLNTHMTVIEANYFAFVDTAARICNRVGRAFVRLMLIGLLMYVVSNLCPEFDEKYPALYGFYTAFLELGEFVVRNTIRFLNSLFTGELGSFWPTYESEAGQLLENFLEWLRNI